MNNNFLPVSATSSTNSAIHQQLSHNDNINKQVPLKTYFLNKYEQLKNPTTPFSTSSTSSSSSSTLSSLAASTNFTSVSPPIDNSVLSALLADSSANNPSMRNTLMANNTSTSNNVLSPISSTLALFQQQQQISQQQQPLSQQIAAQIHIQNQAYHLQQQQQQQYEHHRPQMYSSSNNSIMYEQHKMQQQEEHQMEHQMSSRSNQFMHQQSQKASLLALNTPIMTSAKSSTSSTTATTTTNNSNNANTTKSPAVKRHFSGSNSSLQNSDDDDDFMDAEGGSGMNFMDAKTKEERRRLSHTAAEQKRRNAIKRGYDDLQAIVPSCEFMDPSSSQKVCKATVLKRSIDYIVELEKEKDNHDKELESLKKEIMALRIMKSNYDEILKYHQSTPANNNVEISDEIKFNLFVQFAENLFQSFNTMVNPNSFADMSASMFNWLEQMCSINNLKHIILLSIFQTVQQMIH